MSTAYNLAIGFILLCGGALIAVVLAIIVIDAYFRAKEKLIERLIEKGKRSSQNGKRE